DHAAWDLRIDRSRAAHVAFRSALESMMSREYASGSGIQKIVGSVDPSGRPLGGIELALDTMLRGDSGVAAVARDVRGRRLDSPDSWESSTRAGNNVALTINRDL